MEIFDLSPAVLTDILKLVEQRQSLLSQIEDLDNALIDLQNGKPSRLTPLPRKIKIKAGKITRGATKYRSERIGMKGMVISILKSAAGKNVSVADIASKLGVATGNVHVWFGTTGKKEVAIKKTGRGLYAWSEAPVKVVEPNLAPEPGGTTNNETPIA